MASWRTFGAEVDLEAVREEGEEVETSLATGSRSSETFDDAYQESYHGKSWSSH